MTTLTTPIPTNTYYSVLFQGFTAMVLFSLTVPMTKLSLQLFSADLISASRALGGGLLALAVVIWNRWTRPSWSELRWITFAGLGVVLGFPYLLALTLTYVSGSYMGIALAGLPLATTLMAVVLLGERYSPKFWISAFIGACLLVVYFLTQQDTHNTQSDAFGELNPTSDHQHYLSIIFACTTLFFGGLGYACGAKAAKTLGGWQTICWMLVLYLPISAFWLGSTIPSNAPDIVSFSFNEIVLSVLALCYLIIVSQWLGFKFWYHAMATLGAGTVSQFQLIQPFFTLFFSVLLLKEDLDSEQFLFAVLIVIIVTSAIKQKSKSSTNLITKE